MSPTAPDALARWREVRAAIDWRALAAAPPVVVAARDGHRHYLDEVVAPRDPGRAARLHAALDVVRAEAAAGARLSIERLTSWQRLVLGADADLGLRTRDAFAKQGRERYGGAVDLREQVAACLAEAHDATVPLLARAARGYLDLCFHHPFVDGNARAASLVLDFTLARDGLVLPEVGPLLRVARRADDAAGPVALVRLLAALAGANRPTAHGKAANVAATDRALR